METNKEIWSLRGLRSHDKGSVVLRAAVIFVSRPLLSAHEAEAKFSPSNCFAYPLHHAS